MKETKMITVEELLESLKLGIDIIWCAKGNITDHNYEYSCLFDMGQLGLRPRFPLLGMQSELDARCGGGYPGQASDIVRVILIRYLVVLLEARQGKIERGQRTQMIEQGRLLRAQLKKEYGQIATRPMSLRFQVLVRDNFRCRYCGRDSSETKLCIDHIIPRKHSGPDKMNNYITSCRECNAGKADVLLLFGTAKRLLRRPEGQIPSPLAMPGLPTLNTGVGGQ